jgi:hypothetical protein
MYLLFRNRRNVMASLLGIRSDPFLLFCVLYLVMFCLLMGSAFSNIGLIARQRVMVLEFALILACLRRRTSPVPTMRAGVAR